MKLLRLSVLVTVLLALGSGALLFITSQKVQKAERRLAALERTKAQEQESIRVLRAEWDFLNRPDRLEYLATRYLGMRQPALAAFGPPPPAPPQVGTVSDPSLPPHPSFAAQPVSWQGDGGAR